MLFTRYLAATFLTQEPAGYLRGLVPHLRWVGHDTSGPRGVLVGGTKYLLPPRPSGAAGGSTVARLGQHAHCGIQAGAADSSIVFIRA